LARTIWGALALFFGGLACLPGSGPALNPHEDDAGPPPAIGLDSDGGLLGDVDLGNPFAITGLQPSHGPWTGGTRVTIAGRGFESSLQVTIGGALLASTEVFASSPTRVSAITPPGSPGPSDVVVRNVMSGDERTLPSGFYYDAFAVSPSSGATSGGTRIALQGSATQWTADSTVTVGGQPCVGLTFTDATHLSCTTPSGAPGSEDVTVTNADGTLDQARDAFLYQDSPDGYRGGLYGSALAGNLEVLAFDALAGSPLAGGKAIVGSSASTAIIATLDATGVAHLAAPTLTGKVTVTVAAKCHQPMTFVDVPVDTVTAYLDPELDPSCGSDPPSTGNFYASLAGEVDGELVWTGGIEFERAPWQGVPAPIGNERQVAYVWTTTGNPLDSFQLPPAPNATTPSSDGLVGYTYTLTTASGSHNVYALAGLEDRSASPPRFEPYVMGVASGVLVQPGGKTVSVDIPMTTLLDHAVSVVPTPPPVTARGPDRLVTTLAINVGSDQFALLPQGASTEFLPASGMVSFVGAPSLEGSLAGASYDLTGQAVTGPNGGQPLSVVTRIETTNANAPVAIGGFLPIPTLLQPATDPWNGTHVALQASGPVDLVVVNVSSGNGLVVWQIVSPGSDLSFDLPDLTLVPGIATLLHGTITTTVSLARMDGFDYTQLRSGQLKSSAWNAYAEDTTTSSY
jgi:IPT/TIG domain-containing protein